MDGDAIAKEWIEAFNAHDLQRILVHYHEDVTLSSPVAMRLTGRAQVEGKAALQRYFETGLKRAPDLKVTLLEVLHGATSLCVRYHTNVRDQTACECMELGADGRVSRVLCHYA